MTNNDILRRLRYTFDLRDTAVVDILALTDIDVSEEQVAAWLKREEDDGFLRMNDSDMVAFLNGFINFKRGKRDGAQQPQEKHLNNNMVLQKLRIALNLQAEGVLQMLELAGFRLSKHELSAFFRKPENKNYRECKDQILRKFLLGIQLHLRPGEVDPELQ
ncbi:DUF1456 family protein [Pseudomonas sp. OIL-1]|uniref:DUF1456 family protein n=1 Tax=Pseudomonas sp. OIL-1 TaxID=2706126 RepID=UPI0013A788DF|nr:DUF1456 family protein [Pseudomonas sp. OIL-1]QIB49716.1 DUF1456 family protein [Pseudomonas sp. OIL-1]